MTNRCYHSSTTIVPTIFYRLLAEKCSQNNCGCTKMRAKCQNNFIGEFGEFDGLIFTGNEWLQLNAFYFNIFLSFDIITLSLYPWLESFYCYWVLVMNLHWIMLIVSIVRNSGEFMLIIAMPLLSNVYKNQINYYN